MPSLLPAPAFRPRVTMITPALTSHRLLRCAEIYLAEGRHALAQLTVLVPMAADRQVLEAAVPSAMIWPDRTPVHFTYGSSASDVYDFYGYIASHAIAPANGSARIAGLATASVCYTLTGSSMLMQSAKHQSFPSASASSIARQIAAANQLASYVTTHPRVFPAKVQAALSDFAFLQDLAKQVGWRCWVDNSLLYFVDPTVNLDPAATNVPSFRRDLLPGVWDTLADWQPVVGETDPSGAYLTAHAAYTVRHDSGQLAGITVTPQRTVGAASVAPAFTRIVQSLASSHAEAEYIAAASANNNRFWVHATARTDGHTALRPGRTVNVAGDAMRGSDQGAWRISEAVHTLTLDPLMDTHNTYTTQLTLGRDQEASLTQHPPLIPAPVPGPMTLIGSAWRAALYGGA